jgi:hypothetical protein
LIAEVQSAISATVEVVEDIGSRISEVDTVASSVAAAIEEQHAATQEISRSISESNFGGTGGRFEDLQRQQRRQRRGRTGERGAQRRYRRVVRFVVAEVCAGEHCPLGDGGCRQASMAAFQVAPSDPHHRSGSRALQATLVDISAAGPAFAVRQI